MDLPTQFEKASEEVKTLPEKPSNELLLQLYALYKQGSVGDINIEPPANPFDIVGKAKYNAWSELSGKSREEAMQAYIELVEKLKG